MEYKRFKQQLKIHWHWIKNNEDPEEVYKIIKLWIDTDVGECFLEIVGTPDAQKDQWVYKEIKSQIHAQMKIWVEEAIEEAIGKAIKNGM